MILTGNEIEREWLNGRITIEPFVTEQVNPNSYNFRLGSTLRVYDSGVLDVRKANGFQEFVIPPEGYVLEPRRLYLAHTIEVLGSDHYAPTFAARSSIARLGVFINLSASLGDIGYRGQWTLQLFAVNRVRVYAGINIGQMMWWRPRGEIGLYDGKYQGASGPRSSDIHVDFHRQYARQRLPGLRSSVRADEVGPKFAALASAARDFPVPAAFSIPASEFVSSITEEQGLELADAFSDLQATVGAFFAETVARVQKLADEIVMPLMFRRMLQSRLEDVFGASAEQWPDLAVRSSGSDEDRADGSLAGIHETVLGVRGIDGVVAAVKQCWRSAYAAPAVAARLRAGDFSWQPRLAVIVQAQIEPLIAGVAFTGLDDDHADSVVIEYVEGLADRMVAGVETPTRVTSGQLEATSAGPTGGADIAYQPGLTEVVALARRLRTARGHHVDVEWALDRAGLHLLQVRPLTSGRRTTDVDEPLVRSCPLYGAGPPADLALGDIAGVYGGYVAKRAPAYRRAVAEGVDVGPGWVLWTNGPGRADVRTAARIDALLAQGPGDECVLDVSDTLRQIIVPKSQVRERLAQILGLESSRVQAVVVRDFIRGELGLITRRSGPSLIVEFTPDGLLALNRGTAGAQAITVTDRHRPLEVGPNVVRPAGNEADRVLPHLPTLARFTEIMAEALGEVTLEWVLFDGRVYFVDYSLLGDDRVTVRADGAMLISPGTARGVVLHLEDDDLLARLSIGPAVSIDKTRDVSQHEGLARILELVRSLPEPPVIRASRPYAVLSVLLGHVAGFVFDEGSTLGHLPILLREAAVPAVAATEVEEGSEVVISDGTVTMVRCVPIDEAA